MIVSTIKFSDKHFGRLLAYILSFFSRGSTSSIPKHPTRILCIQLWGVGETVLTLPAIKALQKKYPNASLSILVTSRNKDVYYGFENVTLIELMLDPFSILSFVLHHRSYFDIVVDLEEYLNVSALIAFFVGRVRVGFDHGARARLYSHTTTYDDTQHCRDTFLDLARVLGADYTKKDLIGLSFSKRDREYVDLLLKGMDVGSGPLIGFAPGVAESARSRMWSLRRVSGVCEKILSRHKGAIFFVGTRDESSLVEKVLSYFSNEDYKARCVNLCGALSLTQLFYFVQKCCVFIGNDAGAMHVAAAQGVSTIGLFGPNLPDRFGPYGKANVALYKKDACSYSPCVNVHKGQVPDCLYKKGSKDYQKCMKAISVDEVYKAVARKL